MYKKLLILVLMCVCLYALGDKPKDASESPGQKTGATAQPRYVEPPIEELSADQLYSRLFAEHRSAQSMQYADQTRKAIRAQELFINKYADDTRRSDVLYFLSTNYVKLNQQKERLAVVEDYFETAPTDNRFYEVMNIELLGAYAGNNQSVSANALYAQLQEKYATDNVVLARIHQDMLSVLTSSGDVNGQKNVYRFFRTGNNRNYLRDANNYYIYSYRLAMLYYNEKQYKLAEPLFKDVAAQKEKPILAVFVESSENYLKQIAAQR